MTPQELHDHFLEASATFASLVDADSIDQPIDHLDWTTRDLVAHLGAVYTYASANAAASPSTEPAALGDERKAPDGDAIVEWFDARRAALGDTLGSIDDNTIGWTHAGPQKASWWKRRMAHETRIHLWDLEAGRRGIEAASPLDGDLAIDAIDEFIEVSAARPDRPCPQQSLHLHRTDGPGEWMLVAGEDGRLIATHEHGKGDAAVRGTASDLALWFWGRPATVEIFGDEAVASAWQALAP